MSQQESLAEGILQGERDFDICGRIQLTSLAIGDCLGRLEGVTMFGVERVNSV